MFVSDENKLRKVYYTCLIQFVVILVFVLLFCHPLGRIHMAFVGLSGAMGLMISGSTRRHFLELKANQEQKEAYRNLDTTLKNIKDNDEHGNKI